MTTLSDPVVGELYYGGYWQRNYCITFLGMEFQVTVDVAGEEDDRFIEDIQRAAFKEFDDGQKSIMEKIEDAIYEYYNREIAELRERFGAEAADELAPVIHEKADLLNLLKPTNVFIPWSFGKEQRVVGLLFDCSWEVELGLSVKCVNAEVHGVGTQDLVL